MHSRSCTRTRQKARLDVDACGLAVVGSVVGLEVQVPPPTKTRRQAVFVEGVAQATQTSVMDVRFQQMPLLPYIQQTRRDGQSEGATRG